MNGFSYPSSGMTNNQLPQLTPLSNLPTHPYQQDSPGPSQILPPLHTQNHPPSFGQNVYRGSNENTPRTPHTPATPGSGIRPSSLAQVSTQTPLSAGQPQSFNSAPPGFSSAPPSSFQNGSINPSATTNGISGYPPQHIPPFFEPQSSQNHALGFNGQQSRPSPSMDGRGGQHRLMPVVGSQGRRAPLPTTTPGRPPPMPSAADSSQRGAMQPMKGADGKYACQYCSKVYLHLKHLKRHHLRHTGERPYQCCLCHETFCRSDILKRHFQKCSLRRGNPTGASHLTHAQAHLQRVGGSSNPSSTQPDASSALPSSAAPPSSFQTWQNGDPGHEQAQNHNGAPFESNRSSRSSSVIGGPGGSGADEKKRFSTASNLTPVNTSIDTSPTNSSAIPSASDRRNMNSNLKREQSSAGSFAEPHSANFYTPSSAPPYPSFSQSEQFPSFTYNNSNGYRPYGSNHQESVNGEPWSNYFQPGGQDPVMFSQH